ncbi:hypothetical protein EsDP_00004503 [Epichloe bromicola]|uniref:VOC domain-containing protein n=1 Tax=Epichloe bromicola TaxID=79588 RepID=A0ABQ0CRY1_9HYPO
MPPKLGQIVETILYTSSVPRLTHWYMNMMRITPFLQSPRVAGFHLPNDGILLLFDRRQTTVDRTLSGPNSGVIPKHGTERGLGQHIAFACSGPAELSEWEEHFKASNVSVIARTNWELGGKSIYVKDWEGHVIEIMTRGVWPVY